ncbi:MAG: gamma-glutamylcyclotransferase [Candidatus Peribacteraceae bacterium]|nr:gamma-glutamylcyclotransferase [Candidatus Peribacteraceae bacterium]
MSHKVFVYGTLKVGHGNHRLLEGSKQLGEYTTPPKYSMYSLGGYPGVTDEGETAIQGELYEVNDNTFERLDMLEGYDPARVKDGRGFYDRIEIDTPEGKAWMYTITKRYVTDKQPMSEGHW